MSEKDNKFKELLEYYDTEVIVMTMHGGEGKLKLIERVTQLIVKNRFSLKVDGWGIAEPADEKNPYGAYGLSRDEALELLSFSNMIYGYSLAKGKVDDEKWYKEILWTKVEAIYQEDMEKYMETIEKPDDEKEIKKSPSDGQIEPDSKDIKDLTNNEKISD